jgi:predicted regulator of Ras-like GTPase activity (Roadblock/LC7/MglB family)
MFALIRNLIGRPNRNTVRHSGSLMTSSLAAAPTLPQSRAVSTIPTPCPTPAPAGVTLPSAARTAPAAASAPAASAPVIKDVSGDSICLPLAPITARFPAELHGALIAQPSASATVVLPLNMLVQQLATGAVRLPLGYLRQTSSEPCFASTQQYDAVPVSLPLEEVLARLAPAQLPRRSRQTISVPDSVTAPFGGRNAVSIASPTPVVAAPAPVAEPEPVAAIAFEPEPTPAFAATTLTMPTGAVPQSPAPAAPASIRVAPRVTVPTAAPAPAPAPVRITVQAAAPVAPAPARAVALPPESIPAPFAVPQPDIAAAPAFAAPRHETSFLRAGCLALPLNRLATGWPAPVLQEIANQNLAAENVELPLEEVEAGLKQGRLAFTWRQIRAWTAAVPKPLTESALDSTALELPLRFVAPLFLSQRPMPQRQRAAVGEGIPNVFGPGSLAFETSSFQKEAEEAEAKPAAPAKPAGDSGDAPFNSVPEAARALPKLESVLPASAPAAPAPAPAATGHQTSFVRRSVDAILEDPGKSNWTPMEIVRKISRMKGVAGATMATQDGLLVAEQYPALVGVDTFCALTTQTFNRVFSAAMELRLGGPSRMSFTAESVTYEIYRCGRLYMTVVSQPGERLPTHDLAVIADHLINQSR